MKKIIIIFILSFVSISIHAAEVVRYVDTDSVGGDGTTAGLVGATAAYASLSDWEDGEDDTGDLVSAGDTHIVYCAASAGVADTTAVTLVGWTTGAANYITITTTGAARHTGSYPTGNTYKLEVDGATALTISEEYVRIDGVPIELTSASTNNLRGIRITGVTTADIRISNCIIVGVLSGTTSSCAGIMLDDGNLTGYIWNNVIYDFFVTSNANVGIQNNNSAAFNGFNNTIHNCNTGVSTSGGSVEDVQNNAIFACDDDISGGYTTFEYNATDDVESGTGNINGMTWTDVFENVAGDDFHLKDTDTDLIGAGTDDPSGIQIYSDDFEGDTRTSTWDIGADENVATTSRRMIITKYISRNLIIGMKK